MPRDYPSHASHALCIATRNASATDTVNCLRLGLINHQNGRLTAVGRRCAVRDEFRTSAYSRAKLGLQLAARRVTACP